MAGCSGDRVGRRGSRGRGQVDSWCGWPCQGPTVRRTARQAHERRATGGARAPSQGLRDAERILDRAEVAVLDKGFAATSIDELIAAVGITKSGFFYHFKDKGEAGEGRTGPLHRARGCALRRAVPARRRAQRGPAARLPGGAQIPRRDHGRPAARPSGLSGRLLLLSGAVVQPRGPPVERSRGAPLAPPLPRPADRHRRALPAPPAGRSDAMADMLSAGSSTTNDHIPKALRQERPAEAGHALSGVRPSRLPRSPRISRELPPAVLSLDNGGASMRSSRFAPR